MGGKTWGEMKPEERAAFLRAVRRRLQREAAARRRERRARRQKALRLARRVARMLRERFGATRVVLFGSLVRPGAFALHSDIDLAVWG